MRRALITGITGQDGSYLAELLLGKGYEVHGLIRRASTFNTGRIDHLYQDPHDQDARLFLHYGDLTDGARLVTLLREIDPDEVYNLGAQSHVRVSFDEPEHTGDTTGIGAMRLLEAVRMSGVQCRYYQASSSEMFGATPPPQNEDDAVLPALAVRRGQGLRLLGDQELPRGLRHVRGQRHPLQPRVAAARRDVRDPQDHPRRRRGSRPASTTTSTWATSTPMRDWGYAPEYVEGMWRMLQADEPDDYVLATGGSYHGPRLRGRPRSSHAGLDWEKHVRFDERYLRPTEVDALRRRRRPRPSEMLGWKATVDDRAARPDHGRRRHRGARARGHARGSTSRRPGRTGRPTAVTG